MARILILILYLIVFLSIQINSQTSMTSIPFTVYSNASQINNRTNASTVTIVLLVNSTTTPRTSLSTKSSTSSRILITFAFLFYTVIFEKYSKR